MPDDAPVDPLQLHDLRPEVQRTHALLEQVLARLDRLDSRIAAMDEDADARRLLELVPLLGAVVAREAFTVASIFAYAAEAGAAGEPLRRALDGLSPKACGKLLARAAARPGIAQANGSASREGKLWRLTNRRRPLQVRLSNDAGLSLTDSRKIPATLQSAFDRRSPSMLLKPDLQA